MPCGSQQGCIAQSVSRLTALTGLRRSELIVGDKAEKPGSRVDGDEADELVFQVRRALG